MTVNQKAWPTILRILIAVASIAGFFMLVHEVLTEREDQFDMHVMNWLQTNWISPEAVSDFSAISFFASFGFLLVAIPLVCIVLFWLQKKEMILFFITSAGGAGILIYVTKLFFHRPRPLYPLVNPENSYGFPSGHSTISIVFYLSMMYLAVHSELPGTLKIVISVFLVMLILLVGFSRVYLHMHYPSDVLGGYLMGACWFFTVTLLREKKFI